MNIRKPHVLVCFLLIAAAAACYGQTFATNDTIVKKIWKEAGDNSRLEQLAHELLDVIGPRLMGTPQLKKAHDWAVAAYASYGIEARNEAWGKWRGWERGITHIDLIEPRLRTLEGIMDAWSPPTKKGGVTAGVVILTDAPDSLAFQRWLPNVKGKFVLISQPQPTGRPDKSWEEFALPKTFDTLKAVRKRIADEWNARIKRTGFAADTLPEVLEAAGAAGVFQCRWSSGWGSYRVFGTRTKTMPALNLSLEDYMLVFRLAEHGDNPVLRVTAESKFLPETEALNTLATIQGSEKPNEYVMLSAHFDSWDAASGATDNGTGTILMMEAMRILKKVLPHPKRTIIAGHWDSEEQGLNGSLAFVKDHPEIVQHIQALFNQDNGTGRISTISGSGFLASGEAFGRWLTKIPTEITGNVKLNFPGIPFSGGTDHASFLAAGAPGFGLGSNSWDYFSYTWHTNRDTYDKLVFEELRTNVILTACLVYLASEDPALLSRERRVMPVDEKTGQPRPWPSPGEPERAGGLKK